jgi:tripartite-type tricarboxylate transporter receptor subunit TctC
MELKVIHSRLLTRIRAALPGRCCCPARLAAKGLGATGCDYALEELDPVKRSIWTRLGAMALLASGVLAPMAAAQEFPVPGKAITFNVPFPPGGSADVIARLVGAKLSESLKTPVIIENRGGGAGIVAMQAAAKSAPDGHTIVLGHIGTLAINPAIYDKLGYDPVGDFTPVSLLVSVPNVMVVHPDVTAKTLGELIAQARAKPGSINYGSAGNGSAAQLSMEYLKQVAKLDKESIPHVPYRGTGPMLQDLLGGQIQMTFTGTIAVLAQIKAGKLRPLAVGGAKRLELLPDVPTVAEAGLAGFETAQWYGALVPAGTPPAVVDRLAKEMAAALAHPDVASRFRAEGSEPVGSTPAAFKVFIAAEAARWSGVIKSAGIKPD